MNKKICVITGANRGLGKAMAKGVAHYDYDMVLVCRNSEEANETKEEITRETGNKNIRVIKGDFSSLSGVVSAADEIKAFYPKVDVLINNAAVFKSKYAMTKDGFEEQLAVNYLSVYLFTHELLELLNKSEEPRVINIGSNLHWFGSLSFIRPSKGFFYNGVRRYASTKLAVMMFTFEFARRFEHISCNVFHPGPLNTNIGDRYSHGVFKYGWSLMKNFFISSSKGASTGIYLACSAEVMGKTGSYYFHNKIVNSSALSRNKKLSHKLWEETATLIEEFRHKLYEQKLSV